MLNILERVITESSAAGVVDVNKIAQAVEIGWNSYELISYVLMVWENTQENGFFVHSVLNLIHKLLVSLIVAVLLNTRVQVVHHNVSGVNQVFWRSRWFFYKVSNGILNHMQSRLYIWYFLGVFTSLKVWNRLTNKIKVTKLANWRTKGLFFYYVVLLVEGLWEWICSVSIFHPIYREFIAKTCTQWYTINDVIGWAILSVGA